MHYHESIINQLLQDLYSSTLPDLDEDLRRTWEVAIQSSENLGNEYGVQRNPASSHAHIPPLIRAVFHCQPGKIRELIALGEDINEVVDGLGTPLIWASIRGSAEIVHDLLQAGAVADLNEYTDGRAQGRAIEMHNELVECLQEELDTTGIMYDAVNAALVGRAISEHKGIINRLQRVGDSFSSYGNTALMYAAMKGHGSVVQALLCAGADVNVLGSDGLSAVCYAAIFQHVDVVKDLIRAGSTTVGISSMLHVLPFIPGGLCWVTATLLGFDSALEGKVDICEAIRNRGLRRTIRMLPDTLYQRLEQLLPANVSWPPLPRLLRAVQCIRLFYRMTDYISLPQLDSRNSSYDTAQLKTFLFMVDAESSTANDNIIYHLQTLAVPNEIIILVREAFLQRTLVQILCRGYGMGFESAHLLIDATMVPTGGAMQTLELLESTHVETFVNSPVRC